jgi:hypothetical protein
VSGARDEPWAPPLVYVPSAGRPSDDNGSRNNGVFCPNAPRIIGFLCDLLVGEGVISAAEEALPEPHGESVPPDYSTPPDTSWHEEADGARVRVSDGATRAPGGLGTNVP